MQSSGSASAEPVPGIRVAAWQCAPGPRDVAGNLRRLDRACADAAARGAEILVTPEMFTTGYALSPADLRDLAEDGGGPADAAVAGIARRHGIAIAYGHPERVSGTRESDGDDHGRGGGSAVSGIANAATLVGPDGMVRGHHRKAHLFGDLDRELFTPSAGPPAAFDFTSGPDPGPGPGGVRAGMLICYDVEFPEAVRRLATGGARIVLVPTANMKGYEDVQRILVRARAYENGCGVVYANYCGADEVFAYNGLSVICGPDGSVLAQAGADDEELTVADIPLGSSATYLADRRPDLYG
ncbi:MAG TPA: carbon-nitrogen hydrolase family protein [Trebonia sp.]